MTAVASQQPADPRPPDVFIFEDDDDIRESLRETLEEEGYRVATAANGREGLAMLEAVGQPGVILLDLMMPVMSGWEVLDALRHTEHATVPVVVVTASAEGMVDTRLPLLLRKPVSLNKLLDVIRTYCD